MIEKFPQPTAGELAEEATLWVALNSYWWKILQGKVREIAAPELWENYTEEIDQAIVRLMEPMTPPSPFYGTKVYRTTNITYTQNLNHQVNFEAVDFDTMGGFNPATPARITIAQDCYVWVVASLSFQTNTTGRRRVRILKNGVTIIGDGSIPPTAGGNTVYAVPVPIFLLAGEWIEITAFQSSGGDLDLIGGLSQSWLSVMVAGTEP